MYNITHIQGRHKWGERLTLSGGPKSKSVGGLEVMVYGGPNVPEDIALHLKTEVVWNRSLFSLFYSALPPSASPSPSSTSR